MYSVHYNEDGKDNGNEQVYIIFLEKMIIHVVVVVIELVDVVIDQDQES